LLKLGVHKEIQIIVYNTFKLLALLLLIGKIHICKVEEGKSFMVKNAFISVISEEEKRGSVEFQVFSFTNKIRRLTSHLEVHKKDYLSQRGLRKILGKRQRLLAYLAKKNRVRYKELIGQLSIRETKTR
jgi:small subunit ribosomal protein S15